MAKSRGMLFSVIAILIVLSSFLLPMSVLAKGHGDKPSWEVGETTIEVPWDAKRPYRAQVGKIKVVFEPGTLPELEGQEAYTFTLRVQESVGGFIADLEIEPAAAFNKPVAVKFGSAKVVYYCDAAICELGEGDALNTRGGWVELDHFSRYSGWY